MGDDELVIPGSRRKAVLLSLIALGLVAGGVFLILLLRARHSAGAVHADSAEREHLRLDRHGVQLVRPWLQR